MQAVAWGLAIGLALYLWHLLLAPTIRGILDRR